MEKESTTPEYYPMSLNAVMLACNQKTNRDPVVAYSEDTVGDALDGLRGKGLARLSSAHSRVDKFEHSILEVFNLGRREMALLCTLMLRGPQTVGELHARSDRMHSFSDLAEVESCLETLMRWEPEPLAARLPRQPGLKEPRYRHLLSGESEPLAAAEAPRTVERAAPWEEQIEGLRQEIRELGEEFARFRRQFGNGLPLARSRSRALAQLHLDGVNVFLMQAVLRILLLADFGEGLTVFASRFHAAIVGWVQLAVEAVIVVLRRRVNAGLSEASEDLLVAPLLASHVGIL